jgi:hypothetical protein
VARRLQKLQTRTAAIGQSFYRRDPRIVVAGRLAGRFIRERYTFRATLEAQTMISPVLGLGMIGGTPGPAATFPPVCRWSRHTFKSRGTHENTARLSETNSRRAEMVRQRSRTTWPFSLTLGGSGSEEAIATGESTRAGDEASGARCLTERRERPLALEQHATRRGGRPQPKIRNVHWRNSQ